MELDWLYIILFGAVAGWLTGFVVRGRGFGLISNILIGIVGGVIGTYLFNFFNIELGYGILGRLLVAVVGAALLVFLLGLGKRR